MSFNADDYFSWRRDTLPRLRATKSVGTLDLADLIAAHDYLARMTDTTTPRVPPARCVEGPSLVAPHPPACACHFCTQVQQVKSEGATRPMMPISAGSAVYREVSHEQ